jgi:acyl-CoA thioester hydrolase
MLEHRFFKRIRYSEIDQMGYLYYGRYANLYEIGRVEALRALGLSYKHMEENEGILMPVMSLQSRFLRPATYDQMIEIRTILRKLPVDDITFYCELYNESGELINQGTVKLCFIEKASGSRLQAPKYLIEKLKTYFE